MLYSEHVFLLLLDLHALDKPIVFRNMAALLGLEFFEDPDQQLYTISSDQFVLDISPDGCSLLFVDEHLSDNLKYIQHYFNFYFGDKHTFYFLLRFFVRFSSHRPRDVSLINAINNSNLKKHKNICECVFSNNYCIQMQINEVKNNYNIFTHRKDKVNESPFLVLEYQPNSEISMNRNIFWHFKREEITIKMFEEMKQAEIFYDDGDVKTDGMSVYRNGIRCATASFIFRSGMLLDDAIKYVEELKQ